MNNNISAKETRRLLLSHNLFTSGRVFFEIFLNVYIWKLTEDLTLVAWFNIVYLLLHTITFHLFAPIVKKGRVHFPRKIALVGFTITYLSIYLLKENAIDSVIPIAAAIGFFNGLYWISYQVLRFDLTNSQNRGNYTGLESGTKKLVEMVMPALGGAIIVANFGGWGYSNLFLFGSVLFLVSMIIGNVRFPIHQTPDFNLKKTFSFVRKDSDILKSMFGYSLGSFSHGGTIGRLILPLLIFDVMRNELQLGGWLSFFAIIAIVSSFAFGKFVQYKYYKSLLLWGGVTYVVLIALILFYPSFWIYILFGALIKIVELFITIPKRVIGENLIHSLPNESSHRIEYIVIREWFNIGFGRIPSFVVLLTIGSLEIDQMKLLLGLMAVAVLAEVLLLRTIKREI